MTRPKLTAEPMGRGFHGAAQAPLQGSVNRRDYGPRGCAGFVIAPVLFVALLLRGGRRR